MLEIVLGPTPSRRRPIVVADTPGSAAFAAAAALTASASSGTRLVFASPSHRAKTDVIRTWHRDLWNALDPSDRRRIVLVAGGTAQYLAPLLGEGARVFAFVEDAVEAALALGLKSRALADLDRDKKAGLRRSRAIAPQVNAQSRALLAPWHDADVPVSKGPPQDADEWREALRDVLGRISAFPTEAAAEQTAKIARDLKWFDKQIARYLENGVARPTHRLSEATKAEVAAYCWLDAELHATVTGGKASR